MNKSIKLILLIVLIIIVGIISFFVLEGASPKYYHFLYGPLLIFKYGSNDSYIAVFGTLIFYPLIISPIILKNKYTIIFSIVGIILWIASAKIIEGIAI